MGVLKDSENSIDVGGYVKLDAIFDFNAIGSTDFFAPNEIPTDGSKGSNIRMHARQTRLNLDFRHQLEDEELKVFVEGDFYGSGNSFRLRHAYGSYRNWTAGQTWTTFMDEVTMPDLINFENPTGELLARRSLLRWTKQIESFEDASWSLAIEDPPADELPDDSRIRSAIPDFVARTRWARDRGFWQISAFVGGAEYVPTVGSDTHAAAWGTAVSGRRGLGRKSDLMLQASIGEGYQRFRGFQSFDLNANGRMFAVPAHAYRIGFERRWADTLKSVAVFSHAEEKSEHGISDFPKSVDYWACNLIWQPSKFFRCGAEYLFGRREDNGGATGRAHRIQFGAWYYLP